MPSKVIKVPSRSGIRDLDLNLEAGKRLIKDYGKEKAEEYILRYFELKKTLTDSNRKYCPSPVNLASFEQNFSKIVMFFQKIYF